MNAPATVTLAYTGRRRTLAAVGAAPVLSAVFRRVNADGTLDAEARCYSGKTPRHVIGTILEFKCAPDNDSGIFIATGRITGTLEDLALCAQWKAEQAADEGQSAIEKHVANFDAWRMLEPIRHAYRKTNHAGKSALLGAVIQYLTR